jgi:DNA-binding LytR/AlgR family response regulator
VSTARLSILAVDDEQTQLEDLARILRSSPSVEQVECAIDGHDAVVKASAKHFDAIFLDVRMPNLDGLELARVLNRFSEPPRIVFVSAYDTAAVDAFELRALDYLLKPVSRRRVEGALERIVTTLDRDQAVAENGHGAKPSAPAPSEHDMVAVANARTGAIRLVPRSEILYLQAHGDFVRIVTKDGRYLLRATLAEIENRWQPLGFVRVHRQYVANLSLALELRPQLGGTAELAFPEGHTVPIARRHVPELRRQLGL